MNRMVYTKQAQRQVKSWRVVHISRFTGTWLVVLFLTGLAACSGDTPEPTEVAIIPSPSPSPSSTPTVGPTATRPPSRTPMPVPPTFTPVATLALPVATATQPPTETPAPTETQTLPTNTPIPTDTPIPSPTATNAPPTPVPTLEPTATSFNSQINLLPNGSFENGYYHPGGIPELQVPNGWQLEWDEGPNPLDPDPWNVFVRPESRVLTRDFLPPHEHNLFFWEGEHTVKVFKGYGALSFRLVTQVSLEPGTYLFQINVFPDMVEQYLPDGTKIWAPDPLSGELRFIAGGGSSNWILPTFGQRATYQHIFVIDQAGQSLLGVHFRGRWAIENNGWFMDDWSVRRVS